jgi:flagellar hook-length control protein FliK
MHMQREDGGQESDAHEVKRQSRWRIKLHFNLTELGPLDIDLDLRMPTMSAIFWSQQPDTLARLNQAIAPLRQRLTELGVKVETLQAKHGQRPPQSHGNIQHSLVDIHT